MYRPLNNDDESLSHVVELNLSLQGLTQISGLEALPALRSLNAAFNKLEDDLTFATPCAATLHRLNVSHNGLISLRGAESLGALEVLKCSDNSITSLAPLARCRSLTTLWTFRNPLSRKRPVAATYAPLVALPLLTTLVSTPFDKWSEGSGDSGSDRSSSSRGAGSSSGGWRAEIIALLPQVRFISLFI